MLLSISWVIISSASDNNIGIAQPGCDWSCGGIQIPYPFGMNDPRCYIDNWFEIECRKNNSSPFLKSINVEVTRFINDDVVQIQNPVNRWNCPNDTENAESVVDLRLSPFVYSQERNKFVAISCDNLVLLVSHNGSEIGGCVSICGEEEEVGPQKDRNNDDVVIRDGCLGRYCCQTTLPRYLNEYNTTSFSIEGITNQNVSPGECGYALIGDDDWMNNNGTSKRVSDIKKLGYVPAMLEWEIPDLNLTLNNPPNAICSESNITSSGKKGYRCKCKDGYYGNPYMSDGCTRLQSSADKYSITSLVLSTSLGSIAFLVGIWWSYKIIKRRRINNRKRKYFKQNGGLLLHQGLSSGDVNFDKTKLFTLKDLEKATNHFSVNRVLGNGGQGTVYKGMLLDGQIVAVKKFKVQGNVEEFINEVLILSQINHRNVVKLLGFCLETRFPLLVYEFIPNGNLYEYLHEQNEEFPMTWETRLRIAIEVAGALFYLHSAASQPIYHRDVKSTNILLDEKYRAKVADFGTSRMVSIEDTHLTTLVQGTFGYLDPEYFHTSQFTEKSDVYSFGVVLVELLTGQKPISSSCLRPEEAKSLSSYFVMCMEEDRLCEILDKRIVEEGNRDDIMAVGNLAWRCLELNGRKRPTMKEVTMELQGIQNLGKRSLSSSISLKNHEAWDAIFASTSPMESETSSSLEITPFF
ncbi:wall-associated receptor kinase-like 10 [Senna tora]|uniref:Wall-associated receptor kinase-like 10 n=1 Tax=Senna tora TaxID=362788 RepID=A0A834XC17_9FABA|nr:wall-associated receptor kinase-like 10 [Senna tora]